MEMTLDCFNRVFKTNMTDILDLPVLLKKEATAKYFRDLEARAKAKGIIHGKGGIDKDNGVFFETEVFEAGRNEPVRYRYTFCYAFSSHSLDGICITK